MYKNFLDGLTIGAPYYDIHQVRKRLEKIKPFKYNRYLVVLMIGLSCACFAHLSGGDIRISLITFVAAAVAMFIRQALAHRHYNPIIVFSITAFIASIISGMALKYQLGNDPQIALASSVLLLVPGFPLINSLADILKGHVGMGLGRWTIATILTFGACLGIVFALALLNIPYWGELK
ncbi:Inner membrane protein YjjP [uncultured Avibacterium sp.]|uniref:Inner membrane protein YjjP n=1 Tax=uncultured Avibacterium sp. TaxID=1936169 RepID=A0A486XBT4_9PAST|nr:Inner membrane protein YjjP [uncultured Avibacterium sp.]